VRVQEPEITVARVGESVTVVAVDGELDLHSADKLRAALDTEGGVQGSRLVVDLVGTTLVDSTALGIIAGAARSRSRVDGSLTVVASDPRLLRILRLTGLDRTIPVERSLAEAIARPVLRRAAF
jgi:anti-sigma B factor antagonist